jgi:hypothetical protein
MSQSLDRIEGLARRQTWLLAGIALTGFVALWLVFKTTLNPKGRAAIGAPYKAFGNPRLRWLGASQAWSATTRCNTRSENST